MNFGFQDITAILAIAGSVCAAMRWFVIVPLQRSIDRLDKTLTCMDEKFDRQQERLARVEESTKSAHKRIDRIDEIVNH